jgi:hypothetical protein
VPVAQLTIDFTGVSGAAVTLSASGGSVGTQYSRNNHAEFAVFRDQTYVISLSKNAMRHEGSILCDADAVTYSVPICHITVNFGPYASPVNLLSTLRR